MRRPKTSETYDPFDEALKPPLGETPEAREARLAQERAAKQRSDAIDAAIHQEKLARKKRKEVCGFSCYDVRRFVNSRLIGKLITIGTIGIW